MPVGRQEWWRWIALGIVAVFTTLAVFDFLSFAIETDVAYGHDALMHVTGAFGIRQTHFNWFKILEWSSQSGQQDFHHAPLGYLVASLVMATGCLRPLASIYAAKVLWLILLVICLYDAGRRMGDGPWAGLAAVTFGGLSPIVLRAAREVSLEFPTMVAVAAGIWGYTLTRGFTRRGASVAAGILVGLGLLVKPTPIAFLAPFYLVAYAFPSDPKEAGRPGRGRNLFWCGFAAFTVAGFYYLPLLPRFLDARYIGFSFGPGGLRAVLLIAGGEFLNYLFSPVQVGLLVGALLVGLRRRDAFFVPLVVSAAAGLAFTCAISDFSLTYLYPFRVLFALAIARAVGLVAGRWRAPFALAMTALYLWPLAAPAAAARLNGNHAATRYLRWVYVQADNRRQPLVLAPTPDGRVGVASWEPLEGIGRLLATRYASFHCRDIGVLSPRKGALIVAALVAERPEQAITERMELRTIPALEGDEDPARRRGLTLRPLIVALLPDPDLSPGAAGRAAIVREIGATHRLDLSVRFHLAAVEGAPPARVLFFVANDRRPASEGP